MDKKIEALLISILFIMFSCYDGFQQPTEMTLQYQSPYMQLSTEQPAYSQLDSEHPEKPLPSIEKLKKGFTVKFSANLEQTNNENVLLEIPQILKVSTRLHQPDDWKKQNYPAYPMPDGSIPVMEANLWLEDETGKIRSLTVGLPLSLLERPFDKHDICLQFTGVKWSIYVDNRLYDNDFAIGYPSTKAFRSWKINKKVEAASMYIPALSLIQTADNKATKPFNIQFWTPPYHNAWVGDVATIYHKGRYHLFYLFDRRGHGSKFGKGGHYFEHLSTTDFRNWIEHEPAIPVEHQWECIGTGTPFIDNDRLCLSYGLHTTRVYPKERTALPLLWEYLEKEGHTGSFRYDTLSHAVPAGSTYSISQDGISNFKKTHLLIHPCENPSIYTTNDGSFQMLANYGSKGTWKSDSVSGGWQCINKNFPLGGDCTFPFHWNRHDYIIGGFKQLWYKETQASDNHYIDMVKAGIDFYNGMSVPSIAEIPGNRFLMAGWVKTQNWGGPLVIHELIQHKDGRIGNKWMEEIIPATQETVSIKTTSDTLQSIEVPQQSFLLSFEVHSLKAKQGQLAVIFENKQSEGPACEWQMQIGKERAQFAPDTQSGFEANQRTLREGGDVSTAQNYAIENGLTFEKPFVVRMLIHPSAKVRGTLVDVEIGKQRTMLSYRPGLFANQLKFLLKDVQIKRIEYAVLK